MLSRSQLLSAGPKRKLVWIESLSDNVTIRQLTAAEQIVYVQHQQAEKPADAISHLLTCSLVDEDGKPLFERDDAAKVLGLGPDVINPLMEETLTFSKMKKPETDAAKKPGAGSLEKTATSDLSTV